MENLALVAFRKRRDSRWKVSARNRKCVCWTNRELAGICAIFFSPFDSGGSGGVNWFVSLVLVVVLLAGVGKEEEGSALRVGEVSKVRSGNLNDETRLTSKKKKTTTYNSSGAGG